NANYNGPASFDYTIADGNGGTDTATVNLTVTPVNDAPVAVNDSATTTEDTPVAIAVVGNDTDTDADTLTVAQVNGNPISLGSPVAVANGSVSLQADGRLLFTPSSNTSGTSSFTYTVSDGNLLSNAATVTVVVTPVNDAPVAGDDSINTTEDTAVNITNLGNDTDVDGDPLSTIRVNGAALFVGTPVGVANGSVVLQADGSLTFTPATDYNGLTSFAYTVSDGNGGQDTATVNILIAPANDAPVAVNDSISTNEDTTVNLDLRTNDNDIDGDSLNVTAIDGNPISIGSPVSVTNGQVSLQADGTVSFTPAPDYNGPVSFTYTVADGAGATASAIVNITVNPTNDAPVANDDTGSTSEDTPVNLDLLSNDVDIDGDALSITAVNGTSISTGVTVTVADGAVSLLADGTVVFTPTTNVNGPVSFTYTISDGNGGQDTATASLVITAVNDGPTAVNDNISATEDAPVSIDVRNNDSDPEADPLSVTEINGSALSIGSPVAVANGAVTLQADGSLIFTPAPDFNGPTSFGYTLADNGGLTDTAVVSVNV
ncbi:MAG: Ig-like domain-containing protein, partial [Burkholderiaceae bacterium]